VLFRSPGLSFDHEMHVIRPDVGGQQVPVLFPASIGQRFQDLAAASVVHGIGGLVHLKELCHDAARIGFQRTAAG
jgi:hypothetical protein